MNCTILVTRPAHQSAALAEPLRQLGATVYELPALRIAPPSHPEPFDEALQNLKRFDWVILTSANGVEAVRVRMAELDIPAKALASRKTVVVGPATSAEFEKTFGKPAVVPDEFVGEGIAAALPNVAGMRILLLRADKARKELTNILKQRGAEVDDIAAYQIFRADLAEPLPPAAPDYIVLTSSEGARSTTNMLSANGNEDWMRKATIACIGPITSKTVQELGYHCTIVPDSYTVPDLIQSIVAHHAGKEVEHV